VNAESIRWKLVFKPPRLAKSSETSPERLQVGETSSMVAVGGV
jgi:hypothetical protein